MFTLRAGIRGSVLQRGLRVLPRVSYQTLWFKTSTCLVTAGVDLDHFG